jgi:hypothetical protein
MSENIPPPDRIAVLHRERVRKFLPAGGKGLDIVNIRLSSRERNREKEERSDEQRSVSDKGESRHESSSS